MQTPTDPLFQVVVGYDFSDSAESALDQAVALVAAQKAAVVHVLSVLPQNLPQEVGHPWRRPTYEGAGQLQEDVEAVVEARAGALSREGLRCFVHARIGDPAKELLSLAEEVRADMLVVGTHGRKGLQRLALGSVSEKVARSARCPVVVSRPLAYEIESDAAFAPEPPCPQCVDKRKETGGADWWCDAHKGDYVPPKRYTPSSGGIVQMRPDEWALW